MLKYQSIIRAFAGEPWAIYPEKMKAMAAVLEIRANGGAVPEDTIKAVEQEAAERRAKIPKVSGVVAVVPIMGTLVQRFGMFSRSSGFESTEYLGRVIDELARNESVGAIVLQIDSPGGSVFGTQELAQKIFDARKLKTIVAIADPMAASGAYWLGSQAEYFYCAPSGMVGSIGVIWVHADFSAANEMAGVKYTYITSGRYKAEGNEDEPLADETKAHFQEQSNDYYEAFVSDIARGRGVTTKVVKQAFGEGRMLLADAALEAGMIDKVATMEQVLIELGARKPVSSPSAAAVGYAEDKPLAVSAVETAGDESEKAEHQSNVADDQAAQDGGARQPTVRERRSKQQAREQRELERSAG